MAENQPASDDTKSYFQWVMKAREAIMAAQTFKGKKPPESIQGSIECPKCKGKLNYSIASYNGHVWGRCTTPDCIAWME